MAVHSKNLRVVANGRHLSGAIRGCTTGHSRALSDVTTVLDDGTRWLPGLLGGTLSLAGLFDASTIHAEIKSAVGVDDGLLVTVLPDGYAVGRPAFFTASDLSGYSVDSAVADAVSVSVEATPDDGVDWGVSLHGLTAETVTADGTTVDDGAATTNGGVAVLHVTAFTGLTDATVRVQHSSDGTTWVDLATFATVTATGAQRLAVNGTVNRYLRASWAVTGTGSITFVVAAARR